MARLQILELPTEHHGDDMVTPFVLVVDQVANTADWLAFEGNPERFGARAILIIQDTVEIPANETPRLEHMGTPAIHIEGDLTRVREIVRDEIQRARRAAYMEGPRSSR